MFVPGTPWRRSCLKRSTASSKRSVWIVHSLSAALSFTSNDDDIIAVCSADDLAERVPCHLRSGPCVWSGPHLTGKPPSEDLQTREG